MRPPVSGAEAIERPSIIKQEDIQNINDDEDDAGWAGAQDEVDYNAKLQFDEESDDESGPSPSKDKNKRKERNKQEKSKTGESASEESQPNKVLHVYFP